ncbi:UDP-N-acetylmuramoyl-L-alanyl-D-glutamate--2,6-diaminopimelate ligase [bacterium]|nr:UDP-N-acetylmuramoyl-L-alanyl-D-glutamate--2,6-diaminopimelate ligase [bacterium]
MNRYEVESVTIVGIGGSGAYYIAKFLLLCGVNVVGFDLEQSKRTEELEKMGASITYSNPTEVFDTSYFIYTHSLPEKIRKEIQVLNCDIDGYEVGEMYKHIMDDFEDDLLSGNQVEAFLESDIAPLYSLNLDNLRLIGVTGTDGKTTTCSMIHHILKRNGFKPALISTVSAIIGDEEIDTGFHTTTPTSQELFKLINLVLEAGCTHLVLETTSQGLEQGRLAGLKFDTVAYTNVTDEHLDYHKTWDRYLHSKSLLIKEHTSPDTVIVLNRDDRSYDYLSSISMGRDMDYSISEKSATLFVRGIKSGNGLEFKLLVGKEKIDVVISIYGAYNISNFLAACGSCLNEDLDLKDIVNGIGSFKTVKGRMELIQESPFKVFVDFAHTANSTREVLESVRKLTKGRVIHVFGCAGMRDPSKRFPMGKFSNELADITVLTAEDPRSEVLKDINDEIEVGWRDGSNKEGELIRFDDNTHNVEVRRDAIARAFELAKSGDLVVITGKAHEMSLCFGNVEHDWNDIEESKRLLTIE